MLRSQARPTARHDTQQRRAIDSLSILVANHATKSSKSRVRCAPGRAKGAASTTTPWGNMNRFTVIIPTSGRPEYLFETVDSVLAQTVQDSELIVANDDETQPRANRR
jgi:cellulose synthase/poly-beta-1,6-N-acetylglucosamine synthase-like glycosyltransferase